MAQEIENIRILLLFEDHALFRISLARFLESVAAFEIAGECSSAHDALEILSRSTVEVVLLKCGSGLEGGEFIATARKDGIGSRFLIVTDSPDPRQVAVALRLGVAGIFLESEGPDRLVQAIHHVANGEIWMAPAIIQSLAEQLSNRPDGVNHSISNALEGREQTVLIGILEGLTNKKIGLNMGLSEASVKNIVQRLFGKAGVKTRSQLVRVALDRSWASSEQVRGNTAGHS